MGAVSYSPSIVTMALSCIRSDSEIKPDIRRKSWFFHTPLVFDAPVWYGKTRMVGLADGEKILRMSVTVYTQYRRVSDGQTDILPRHSPRYAYASRGNYVNSLRLSVSHT